MLRYGGQLLSTYEYDVLRFMVIYISVVMVGTHSVLKHQHLLTRNIQGGQAAGQFGSLTPSELNIPEICSSPVIYLTLRYDQIWHKPR